MGDMKVQFRDMERQVETQPVKIDGRFNRSLFKIQILGLVSYSHYSCSTTFSKGIWLRLIGYGGLGFHPPSWYLAIVATYGTCIYKRVSSKLN